MFGGGACLNKMSGNTQKCWYFNQSICIYFNQYMYIYFNATEPCDLLFMPQSQMPYGDRTAPVRCQILQNRTVAARFLRAPYSRSSFLAQVTIVTMGYSHRFWYVCVCVCVCVCVRCAVVNFSNKTYLLLEFSLDSFEILGNCSV